ncbi:acetyl-CoA carboxylase biotin carboxylase subunit [Pararhodobacter sp.]|uniref:acetyl-CoA carboxylase biotin carboxylase subunit n=1 Tax=Pararhodobacter sp. TaxID=2127056 RepID=UPI002AFE4C2E|nr:biotin carboxylase N-terminal domain-containing protein [Pararhodobacter sp.]
MSAPILLVANRGEIALRVIRAARGLGLGTVSVYSEADADLPHAQAADRSVCIGPARAQDSYMNIPAILAAARETGATLIHPGYGFLSENAGFAQAVREAGLVFVGPDPEHIRLMGDKHNARTAALAAGVPVLPGTGRLPDDPALWPSLAEAVGFPLLVKAVAGGGGHGMRVVEDPAALVEAIAQVRQVAARAFGDDGAYLERFLSRARHVEVQIFGFGDGRAVHMFERDCTLQRRHQKVVEEAPAPGLPDPVRAAMAEAAVRLATSIGFAGAGTVEYLYDPVTADFFFLEMNTRIQVEHPVTEMVTGTDLVAAQIRLAMGQAVAEDLRQDRLAITGHAIEARIYAENPEKRFLPSPGPLDRLELPQGEGLRVECGYGQGDLVTPHYDPLVIKLIAHGADREQAIARLLDALDRLRIEGIRTNAAFVGALLVDARFATLQHDTRMLDRG